MRAIDPYLERKYIPASDEKLPPEQQTVIRYTLLSAAQFAHYQNVNQYQGIGTATLVVWHMAVRGVDALDDGKGGHVEFARDTNTLELPGGVHAWSDACMSRIPAFIRDDLAGRIIRESGRVEEETAKKS